jgi:hypothetical protein
MVDAAEMELSTPPATMPAGSGVTLRVRIANAGSTTWPNSAGGGEVRVGLQLLADNGSVIDRNYARHSLPAPILPGGRCELAVHIVAPSMPGQYQLKLDLVREGMHWFEMHGSRVVVRRIDVT